MRTDKKYLFSINDSPITSNEEDVLIAILKTSKKHNRDGIGVIVISDEELYELSSQRIPFRVFQNCLSDLLDPKRFQRVDYDKMKLLSLIGISKNKLLIACNLDIIRNIVETGYLKEVESLYEKII